MSQICKIITSIFIFTTIFSLPAIAIEKAEIKYDDNYVDYSLLNADKVMAEADDFFDKYEQTKNPAHLTTAMGKYYILTKIYPTEIYPNVQLARTYGEKNLDRLAKSYFNKCYNIDKHDPYLNYYFGDFYYSRKDYKRALRLFKIAYNYGYSEYYDLNLKIATIYEKFADLKNAKYYYNRAYSLNKSASTLKDKVQQIESLNYDKSEYYTGK